MTTQHNTTQHNTTQHNTTQHNTTLKVRIVVFTLFCLGAWGELFAQHEWTWISGSDTRNQTGVYGTQGVAASTNVPGARQDAAMGVDSAGNLFVFGGRGRDAAGNSGELNDLWMWDGTDWTWITGSNTRNQSGVYGTKGVAAGTNVPGGRRGATMWMDTANNLIYIFGGLGRDVLGNSGKLNDLWRWDGTNWTWISGDNREEEQSNYGTQGVPASTNVPGARYYSASWMDEAGNLYLFGGNARLTSGDNFGNDLWRWDGTNWTWLSGNTAVSAGVYGTKGVPAASNVPGGRREMVASYDTATGNVYIFGGTGFDALGVATAGFLNDLWRWDGTNWTWLSGRDTAGQPGNYGTQGVAASTNVPGGRNAPSMAWVDTLGDFYIFGGNGYIESGALGRLNDLWKWDGTNWTWVSGSKLTNQMGVYGTLGVTSPSNEVGGRVSGFGVWSTYNQKVYLFGGLAYDANGDNGIINDLWVQELFLSTPGNVSTSLELWLRSDEGVTGTTTVTDWADQSETKYTISGIGGTEPALTTSAMNYNPSITYDGSNDYLDVSDGLTDFTAGLSAFVVTNPTATRTWARFFDFGQGAGNDNILLARRGGSSRLGLDTYDGGSVDNVRTDDNTTDGIANNQVQLFASTIAGGTAGTTQTANLFKNGRTVTSVISGTQTYVPQNVTRNNNYIARSNWSADQYFQGDIAEVILYTDDLSAADRNKVESYLAVKYGITLDNTAGGAAGDYFNSEGDTIWDASVTPAYHNDIIGIMRDDNSNFTQKQSHTADDSLRLYISTLAANNGANAGSITNDQSSILIGDNGGLNRHFGSISNTEVPAGIHSRLVREWKVTNDSFVDDYSIDFTWDNSLGGAFDINDVRLLVDADGDFTNATIISSPDVTFSSSGATITVSGIGTAEIPMDTTLYFTLASNNAGTQLPVAFTTFTVVEEEKDQALLTWTTATETNNQGFVIERSVAGQPFEAVGYVAGAGNSNEVLDYSFTDQIASVGAGDICYRLRQEDYDGSISHSPVDCINRAGTQAPLIVYPNPSKNGTVTVSLGGKAMYELQVIRPDGVIIYDQLVKGQGVKIADLQPGVYFFKALQGSGDVSVQRVVIQ